MLLQPNMVIEPNPAAFPLRMNPWLGRQRLQVRRIHLLEQLPARAPELAQDAPLVEIGKALGNGSIELGQAVEDAIAQTAQHPALDDPDTQASTFALSLGLLGRAGSTAVP